MIRQVGKPMRVFVLTTGRTASKTFAYACKHLDGMTAGHETNVRKISDRLDYPDNHVEVDNRLVWFLGALGRRYEDDRTFYVYLTRNTDKVVESYLLRWHMTVSIVRAFYHGILMNPKKPDTETARQSCRFFVETVDENIRYFLRNRNNWAHVSVENLEKDFFAFMTASGLTGDRKAISRALHDIKNVNKKKYGRRTWTGKIRAMFSSRRLY